jgi:hypothetical protein
MSDILGFGTTELAFRAKHPVHPSCLTKTLQFSHRFAVATPTDFHICKTAMLSTQRSDFLLSCAGSVPVRQTCALPLALPHRSLPSCPMRSNTHHICALPWLIAVSLSVLAVACNKPASPHQTAPEAVAPTPAQPQDGPHLAPSPGTFAGTVQCGQETCRVRESICVVKEGAAPRCVPIAERTQHGQHGKSEDNVIDCDDNSDCAAGEQCCAGQYWGGTGPHMHVCTKDRCMEAIACVPASGCPTGLTCKVGPGGFGHCEPIPGVQCGNVRCKGATPLCCWDATNRKGRCVADPGPSNPCTGDDEESLRCRGRKDCGGYDCCRQMVTGTDCWSSCPGPALGVACETFADCPPEGPGPGGMRQRYDRCEDNSCTGKLCNPSGEWVPCDSL